MLGSGCAKLQPGSVISGSTPRTSPSCSHYSCYSFVRPKRSFLEVCVFLGRSLKAPQVRRVDQSSRTKFVHVIQIRHRDEVEAPITDWLQEAYEWSAVPASKASATEAKLKQQKAKRTGKARIAKTSIPSLFDEVEYDENYDYKRERRGKRGSVFCWTRQYGEPERWGGSAERG